MKCTDGSKTLSLCNPFLKSYVVFSISGLLVMVSTATLKNIQSSLHATDGLGNQAQAIRNAAKLLTQLTVSVYIVRKLGLKTTIALSMLFQCLLPLAGFYPYWFTLLPTAFLGGLASAPATPARYEYTMQLSENNQRSSNILATSSLLFGLYNSMSSLGYVIGGSLTYVLLIHQEKNTSESNDLTLCGSGFSEYHSVRNISHFQSLPEDRLLVFYSVVAGCPLFAAILVFCCLDGVGTKPDKKTECRCSGERSVFKETGELLRDKNFWFLTPIALTKGLTAGFVSSDFTKAFVSCTLGMSRVGLILLGRALSNIVVSALCGTLVRSRGARLCALSLSCLITCAVLLFLLFWDYGDTSPKWYLLVFASVEVAFSVPFSIWKSQLPPLYGLLFPKTRESSFNMLAIMVGTGEIAAWTYSRYLNIQIKMYVVFVSSLLGLFGYWLAERRVSKKADVEPKIVTISTIPLPIAACL